MISFSISFHVLLQIFLYLRLFITLQSFSIFNLFSATMALHILFLIPPGDHKENSFPNRRFELNHRRYLQPHHSHHFHSSRYKFHLLPPVKDRRSGMLKELRDVSVWCNFLKKTLLLMIIQHRYKLFNHAN